jgi:hypothetical protein
MKIKKMNWFVKLITFNWPNAVTLVPFGIYIKEGHFNDYTINEERIHEAQQKELFIIPFYIWYFIECLVKLSYRKIGFEREAKSNRFDFDYLKTRKKFAWVKRIIK